MFLLVLPGHPKCNKEIGIMNLCKKVNPVNPIYPGIMCVHAGKTAHVTVPSLIWQENTS